ncbi:hypothetical protein [uncultured Brevundimonas sp.]|uniref:hypothetical protein n=1 Tax=uncultured Brevundimonas sp. TaxID=213418 RepID=UPI002614317B|nr:hypothetical protein [uncultured Brevundimonas sp.]
MSYGDDFAGVDSAGAPLDPTIMIGAGPMFWSAMLLAIALAALLGWWLGQGRSHRRPDAAVEIWEAIDKALRQAMQAHDGVLLDQAQQVLSVIDGRLGRTLALARGLSGPLEELRKAVAGTPPPAPPATAPASTPAGAAAPPSADAEADGDAPGAAAAAASASAASGNVTIVNVSAPPPPSPPAPPPSPPPPPPPPSPRNQLSTMRLAIAALNQHWREKDRRVAELREAHRELSGP